jgi:hypothetical protein
MFNYHCMELLDGMNALQSENTVYNCAWDIAVYIGECKNLYIRQCLLCASLFYTVFSHFIIIKVDPLKKAKKHIKNNFLLNYK